jgi:hypothetical protein
MDMQVNDINQAIQILPAIETAEKLATLSPSYQLASTRGILDTLGRYGWTVAGVSALRSKHPERRAYAKHGVRLISDAYPDNGAERPQIVLRNAHDGSSALVIKIGFYRFACANQTVVGSTLASLRILHRDYSPERLLDGLSALLLQLPQAMAALDTWRGITLSDDAERDYLDRAATLRWGDAEAQALPDFGTARRYEDNVPTLYGAYQRAQESLVRGGGVVIRPDAEGRPQVRRARAIRGLDANLRINSGLWDLTAQTASAMA